MTNNQQPGSSQQEMELENLKNEVLRKIGRNVMLFQQLEHLLKAMLDFGNYSGYFSELQQRFNMRQEANRKKTMGQLVEPVMRSVYSNVSDILDEPEELREPWVSFRYGIACDDSFRNEQKETLQKIVDERNELIHHLWPKWNTTSIQSGKEVEQFLDEQRERILPELDILKGFITGIKEYSDFYTSEEGQKQIWLSILRQSPLVAWLFNLAEQNARPDGWIALNTAVQIIRQYAPQELTGLKKRYGYEKLKAVLLATEFFDIWNEPTEKGGIRVLYRIKPDLVFDE
jgi:hypothetical protein